MSDLWDGAYQLLDCGDFLKLERFGDRVLIRPEPQALWPCGLSEREWLQEAHLQFEPRTSQSGEWVALRGKADPWSIRWKHGSANLKFLLRPTSFKHVGLFPEQAENWVWLMDFLQGIKTHQPKVLNLFAYTGGASLAARAVGADVIHLDAVKQVVTWAKDNMEASDQRDIRWVVEDAVKFVERERKRGRTYDLVILDPPAYGIGPSGERWKLEEGISSILQNVSAIIGPGGAMLLNTYSLNLSPTVLHNLVLAHFGKSARSEIGELSLPASSGYRLPLGVYARVRV